MSSPDTLVLFHFSIGSEVTSFFASLPDRRALVYHNITPPEYFVGVNARVADRCRRGRWELARLRGRDRARARGLGVQPTGARGRGLPADRGPADPGRLGPVRPPPGPGARRGVRARAEPPLRGPPRSEQARGGPRQGLLLLSPARPGQPADPRRLGGGHRDLPRRLPEACAELGLLDHVVFTGSVSQAELCTYYRLASAYLCLSEHEGFCVPLLEAMHFDVPVVAYASTGVPGTMGDAGLLVQEKDFPAIAELSPGVHDPAVRAHRRRRQRAGADTIGPPSASTSRSGRRGGAPVTAVSTAVASRRYGGNALRASDTRDELRRRLLSFAGDRPPRPLPRDQASWWLAFSLSSSAARSPIADGSELGPIGSTPGGGH